MGQKIAIRDMRECDFVAGSEGLDGHLSVAILSGQTFPPVSRSSALEGMVTAYWREVHKLSVHEL